MAGPSRARKTRQDQFKPDFPTVPQEDILKIVHAAHYDPHTVLGLHPVTDGERPVMAVRAFVPTAKEMFVVPMTGRGPGKPVPMQRIHGDGFFETLVRPRSRSFRYRLRAVDYAGNAWEFIDPYIFPPLLTEFDLHLFGEGNYLKMYEKLGAHLREVDGVKGVNFAVWAPNAVRVSVVGNFNAWDGRRHCMRVHPGAGVWEMFIPELDEGELYKFEIKTRSGDLRIKTDPVGFQTELRPANASIVYNEMRFSWNDNEWMQKRHAHNGLESPIAIYEVHLGSWKRVPEENNRPLTYRELAHQLVDYVKDMGYTHVELLPITEHPFDGSWGYQTTGYYAATSRYGAPDDFKYFVDYLHQHDIGVILDWVPAHFPKDDFALRWFDGTHLYEHADPRKGEHPDWGTLIFNYGRNEVRNFLISNALYWLDEFHVDGLRVDAVASMLYLDYSRKEGEWLPNEFGGRENLEAIDFLRRLNETVYAQHPDVMMIAEESTAWPGVSRPTYLGGLGFGFKWNMGWMNDFLRYIEKDPIHRKYHHNDLTFGLIYAFTENFILVLSHDEVVHGKRSMLDKMPGDLWQKFANLRLAYAFMYAHPGKKLLFMGNDIGVWEEWNHSKSLDWHLLQWDSHRQLQQFMRDLNHLYQQTPALWRKDFVPEGFQWIDFLDSENSVISFIRRGANPDDEIVVVCNFTPVPRYDYRIGVPRPGFYKEILNSDSNLYGGSNLGNYGGKYAESIPWHGFEHSLSLVLPPLAAIYLKRADLP
ncbi:MAG: 1,4-alpha-glucan branching protein GlgB [candidate division KSB1 bacterium]|nr:1,4-alpha-glucan branching protein GlgB [candidate division KSB1 bacterium]